MHVTALEDAILSYIDSDKSALIPFYGNCKDFEPFGDKELGNIINEGDVDSINQKLEEINFSNVNFGLFKKKEPKTQKDEKEQKYFNAMSNIVKKLDGNTDDWFNLFKKSIAYIVTQVKETSKKPSIPKLYKNLNISENEWNIFIQMVLGNDELKMMKVYK